MKTEFNLSDLEIILTSFKYSKDRIENYQYPSLKPGESVKLRQQRLNEINAVEVKIHALKKELKGGIK